MKIMNPLEETVKGDSLYVASYGGFGDLHGDIKEVERTTKTQVILKNGQRFKRNGSLVGGGAWSRAHARPATESDRLRVKATQAASKIKMHIDNTPILAVIEMYEIMKTAIQEEEEDANAQK